VKPLPPRRHALISLAILVGAFAVATALAGLLGATNLGTAISFGQMGFALALLYVLLRR
jgi:hypothetical protein